MKNTVNEFIVNFYFLEETVFFQDTKSSYVQNFWRLAELCLSHLLICLIAQSITLYPKESLYLFCASD